jgi:hypothetical protein
MGFFYWVGFIKQPSDRTSIISIIGLLQAPNEPCLQNTKSKILKSIMVRWEKVEMTERTNIRHA